MPCIVKLRGKSYDLEPFLNNHPAGADIILEHANSDITEVFEGVNHTKAAERMLPRYEIDSDSQINDVPQESWFRRTLSGLVNISWKKLFTRADRVNVSIAGTTRRIRFPHKTMGIVCLAHYGYRFYHAINGDRGMSSYASLALLWCHALLSMSSLIFHVPNKQTTIPMIWREFRAHNILFAMRSVLCASILWSNLSPLTEDICKYFVIFATMYAADKITKTLRVKTSQTTTRTLPYWPGCHQYTMASFRLWYTLAQYQATMSCVSRNIFIAFSVMFPIQLASLLMTLVRKNIISSKRYHQLYLMSLLMPLVISWNVITEFGPAGTFGICVSSAIAFFRIKCGFTKYYLWSVVCACDIFSDYPVIYVSYMLSGFAVWIWNKCEKRRRFSRVKTA